MHNPFQKKQRSGAGCKLFALVAAFLFCLSALFPSDALAQNGDTQAMVNAYDATQWASLTLKLTYTKEEGETPTPLDGADLRLVRVADLSIDSTGAHFTLRAGLPDYRYDFTKMTSSELHNASTEIASYLSEHPEALKALEQEQNATVKPEPNAAYKAVRRATSNAQGQVSFDHLVHGVYLITQEGREGTAKEFTPLSPVLFFVPQYLKTETGAGWLYDVVANPKYSPEKPEESSSTPPETPPKPPKPSTPKPTPTPGTGDKIRLGIWAGTGLLAFLALLLLFRSKRKNDDQ